jgi:septal ring factor EnvC (AmiA/AmiB activator)
MTEHTDPTVLQAWLIAVPSLITAVSTWYLRRGTKKSHASSEAKTTEKLDSYNGAIKDKIEELETEIKRLKESITKSVDDSKTCQITLAQKYTEQINGLQNELVRARRVIEKVVPSPSQTQIAGEQGPKASVAAESPSAPTTASAAPGNGKPFGEVKIVETPKPSVGKVKWEKGE